MKCIVGLGNPGEKFARNRHNVGFMTVEALNKRMVNGPWSMVKKFNAEIVRAKDYILVKPLTFMNESGVAVTTISQFYKIKNSDLYVVHDDLDIMLGKYKIQHARGPQVHYGVNSVEDKLGGTDFWRVRVGVENRAVRGNSGVPGEVYSLQDFDVSEQKIVDSVIESICTEMVAVLQGPTS